MLPPEFIFSQNSLQQYVDCKRRFYLEQLLRMDWPANQSEPVILQEQRMAIGSQFHLLCSQFFHGIPVDAIQNTIESPEVMRWWEAFLALGLSPSPNHQPEKAITLPFEGYRLTAHYDLLIEETNKFVIYDWKTNTKHPPRQQLQDRMQTMVYPLVLHQFVTEKESKQFHPIELVYWYPEFPDQPHRFGFNEQTISQQSQLVSELIKEISISQTDDFLMTDDTRKCTYCQFRSYCNRGQRAGGYDEEQVPGE